MPLLSRVVVTIVIHIGITATVNGAFKSRVENLNFKVNYRIQTFVNGEFQSILDVIEQYHSSLATGLIKQIVHSKQERDENQLDRRIRKIWYDTERRRLYEHSKLSSYRGHAANADEDAGDADDDQDDAILQDDFYLYENGGSSSYDWEASAWQLSGPIGLALVERRNLDSSLLLAGSDAATTQLDLNEFMQDDCLESIKSKLHYVNGVTRLLLLIECRRQEFKLAVGEKESGGGAKLTRGQSKRDYVAQRLEVRSSSSARPAGAIDSLSIRVAISSAARDENSPSELPESTIPLSVAVQMNDGKNDISLLINVFQFESLEPGEHVSESASAAGHSSYMLPMNHMDLVLGDSGRAQSGRFETPQDSAPDQYSFHATLSASRASSGPLFKDPVELIVWYDRRASMLAIQMDFVDRSRSSAFLGGWNRNTIRTLHDGQSGLKYHLMRSNFNYNNKDELGQEREMEETAAQWRSCATDELDSSELAQLETGDGHMFSQRHTGGSYLGAALVRGILCHVYELRLFKLPAFFGLTLRDFVHLDRMNASRIYLQSYVVASRMDGAQFLAGQMASDAHKGKFVRLDLRIVSGSSDEEASFRLEVHSFDWSGHVVQDVPELLNIGRECLMSNLATRHLDVELWLQLRDRQRPPWFNSDHKDAISILRQDVSQRNAAVSRLLAEWLDISQTQQVDLESELSVPDEAGKPAASGMSIRSKFSLFELLADTLAEQFIGYARDLSPPIGDSKPKGLYYEPLVGVRSYTYDECKWRAAHTLVPAYMKMTTNTAYDQTGATNDEQNSRIFMFCPQTLVCTLGDSQWAPMRNLRKLRIDRVLEFPYPQPQTRDAAGRRQQQQAGDRCLVAAIQLRPRRPDEPRNFSTRRRRLYAGNRPLLDWLLAQQADDFQQLRELSAELRVELERVDVQQQQDGTTSSLARQVPVSFEMQISRMKLSNRVFTSSEVGRSDTDDQAASLLTKPLRGLGYLAARQKPVDGVGANVTIEALGVEPFVVSNLAECDRMCLLLHECQTYSACHLATGKLACLFSKLSWSNQSEFKRLVSLAQASRSSGGASDSWISIAAGGSDGLTDTQVQMKRSKLCSLYGRSHADLYRPTRLRFGVNSDKNAGKFLIYARTSEQCARFCLERAHLMRQLAASSDNDSSAHESTWSAHMLARSRNSACLSFLHSRHKSACELLPHKNHWSLLGLEHMLRNETPGPSEAAKSAGIVGRWRGWFGKTPMAGWLASMKPTTNELDSFELDFRQVFHAQQARRLVKLDTEAQIGAVRLQLRLYNVDVGECANRCMNTIGCRSFDIQLDTRLSKSIAASATQTRTCVLNGISLGDLSITPNSWPMFRLESNTNSSSEWWHYEPSELALYLFVEPHEMPANYSASLHGSMDDDGGVFIRAPSSRSVLQAFGLIKPPSL